MTFRNQRICEIFEKLHAERVKQGEIYRAKAYEKIIPILRAYPKDIESAAEARLIPGIGDRISAKIDEIIRTGTLAELESSIVKSAPNCDRDQVLKLFQSIERVGEKTALKWYNKGYRQISDIPTTECTTGQLIGIQLYNDLAQRISKHEINQVDRILSNYLAPFGIQFMICGSYRRGKSDSGDIDILLVDKEGINVINEVIRCPIFTHTLAHGKKKFLGICKINQFHRRIDLELVQPHEYPYAVVYFTGPAKFNVMMRQRAIDLGVRLNEKSLTKEIVNESGQTSILYYHAQTEEDVFSLLGIQYLTPQEREHYA